MISLLNLLMTLYPLYTINPKSIVQRQISVHLFEVSLYPAACGLRLDAFLVIFGKGKGRNLPFRVIVGCNMLATGVPTLSNQCPSGGGNSGIRRWLSLLSVSRRSSRRSQMRVLS